jgi:hypothetical protein
MCLGPSSWEYLMRRALVGSDRLGSGCLVLRADTRENPGGKNGVMTGSKPNIEELEIVNLADKGEEPREVKIGTRCAAEQKEALIALLREFHEIFAWSYQDMPGLDTDIVVHKCHNPIFTPGIFSSVGAQNETARTKPV